MDYSGNSRFESKVNSRTVLIADPSPERPEAFTSRLSELGFEAILCSTLAGAKAACMRARPAHVLTELSFQDGCGMQLVRFITANLPSTRTVVHTWFADIPAAVAAAKAGAADLVPKPTHEEFLISILLFGSDRVPVGCRIQTPARVRQEHVEHIVKLSRSNVSLAASRLLLDRRSLQRMLKRYRDDAQSQVADL